MSEAPPWAEAAVPRDEQSRQRLHEAARRDKRAYLEGQLDVPDRS